MPLPKEPLLDALLISWDRHQAVLLNLLRIKLALKAAAAALRDDDHGPLVYDVWRAR